MRSKKIKETELSKKSKKRDIQIDFSPDKSNSSSQPEITKYKVNMSFIILYILTMAANGICVAWTTGGNNQTASIFAAKLEWTADETRKYNSLINFSSQLGKAMGAYFGGRIITQGRKKVFIKYNILAIVACLIMQIVSVFTLSLGKFLHGFFVTVVHMA